jgi:hypothetical protein
VHRAGRVDAGFEKIAPVEDIAGGHPRLARIIGL